MVGEVKASIQATRRLQKDIDVHIFRNWAQNVKGRGLRHGLPV
jgi:hypothetical protein